MTVWLQLHFGLVERVHCHVFQLRESVPDMGRAGDPLRSRSKSRGSRGRRAAPSRTSPRTRQTPLQTLPRLRRGPGRRGRTGTRTRRPPGVQFNTFLSGQNEAQKLARVMLGVLSHV